MYLKSVNTTLYLSVCIHVFMLHDQILECQLECDQVSVVKCGSLVNTALKKMTARKYLSTLYTTGDTHSM